MGTTPSKVSLLLYWLRLFFFFLLDAFWNFNVFSHFCMDLAQIFRAFVTFKSTFNQYDINFRSRVIAPWRYFSGSGFHTKAPKVLKLGNQMNLNTRDIVVVYITFRFLIFFDFASEGRSRKSIFEQCSLSGHVFF